jgi:hypothetical protein
LFERIARIKRRDIPHECFRDRTMMSKWIDKFRARLVGALWRPHAAATDMSRVTLCSFEVNFSQTDFMPRVCCRVRYLWISQTLPLMAIVLWRAALILLVTLGTSAYEVGQRSVNFTLEISTREGVNLSLLAARNGV